MPLIPLNVEYEAETGKSNLSTLKYKVIPVTPDEEYTKNPDLKKEDINDLKNWIKTQPHLPQNVKEEQLILFHHSCFYDIEATKKCIEVYYSLRSSTPEFFSNRDLKLSELQQALKVLYYGCFPFKDDYGNQIIFHKLKIFDANKYVFSDGVKLLSMAMDSCLYTDGTAPGYTILFDMHGVKFSHLTRLNVSQLKKFFIYIQEGIPIRLKAIHVLNAHSLVDKVMMIIKPFLKKELIQMIHFHKESVKPTDILPKRCLPKDYSGDLPSCDELHENYINWMQNLQVYFKEEEIYRINESNRVSKKKSKASAPPEPVSLHNLCID